MINNKLLIYFRLIINDLMNLNVAAFLLKSTIVRKYNRGNIVLFWNNHIADTLYVSDKNDNVKKMSILLLNNNNKPTHPFRNSALTIDHIIANSLVYPNVETGIIRTDISIIQSSLSIKCQRIQNHLQS